MMTTKQINVNLSRGKLKLRQMTTKNIDAGLRVEPPKEPIKKRSVTTTTQQDVADIAEKKRRDDIAVEKKLAMRDAKKVAMAEKETTFKENMATYQDEQNKLISKEKEIIKVGEEGEKKPWLEMTDVEKKVVYKERAKRAAATRAAKKKG